MRKVCKDQKINIERNTLKQRQRDFMNKSYLTENTSFNLPDILFFQNCAKKSMQTLPISYRDEVHKIKIQVENFAEQETLKDLNMKNKYDLLGLYKGTPVNIKVLFSDVKTEDCIVLYRCPLIRYCHDNSMCIEGLVHRVMLHELGHHFGCTFKS